MFSFFLNCHKFHCRCISLILLRFDSLMLRETRCGARRKHSSGSATNTPSMREKERAAHKCTWHGVHTLANGT